MVVRNWRVELWDVQEPRLLKQHRMEPSMEGAGHALRDDGRVAAVSTDEGVTLWDPDKKPVRQLPLGRAGRVSAFGKNGRLVVGVDTTSRKQLWDSGSLERVAELWVPGTYAPWFIDDQSVQAGYDTGWARLPLDRKELVEGLCRAVGRGLYPDDVRRQFPPQTDPDSPC